jgi:hypothetical protein
MKLTPIRSWTPDLAFALVLVFASSLTSSGAGSAPPSSPSALATNRPPVVKAVFAPDLPTGKDPFFPETRRRQSAAPSEAKNAAPLPGPIEQLKLKGVSLANNRRLALINNQTLAEGETARIKVPAGSVDIQCLKIHEHSVRVRIVSTREEKELTLPKDS